MCEGVSRYVLGSWWHGDSATGLAEEVEGWSEAERHGAATGAEWASRRSAAQGLGVMWYARSRETTSQVGLASEYIGLVVSARSAHHITERQGHGAGTEL